MKNFSIVMCFVAIFAAATTFVTVLLNNNKTHDAVTTASTNPPFKNEVINSTPLLKSQSGYSQFIDSSPNVPIVKNDDLPKIEDNNNIPSVEMPQEHVDKLYDPNSSVIFAAGDILTIPKEDQPHIRYLSLYNIPKAKRKEYGALISFVVNSLSKRRKISIPQFVGASDETVVRLDMRDYEWNRQAWEDLAKKGSGVRPRPEPYFHDFIEKPILEKVKVKKKVVEKVPWVDNRGIQYVNRDGSKAFRDVEKEIEVEEVVSNRREKIFTVASWLDPLGMKTLVNCTLSESPIVRADWFISNVIVPPAYYNFLGIGNNIKDFEKLVFADEKLAREARSQDKGIVISSMVTRNNRTLTRSPTFTGGYYWRSHDTKISTDDRNYVRFILDEKFDATEDIATLPNGLQAYFLSDGKGKRLDEADINIAVDNTAVDRVVRAGRSCMICHSDGIRPINDEIRSLTRKLQNKEQVRLLVTKREDAERIEDLFSSDLDEQIVKDQNLYRSAVSRASGLSSVQISELLNEVYTNYVERLLTMETVIREVGVNLNEIESYITASRDNVILGLVKTPIRPVRRDQWEQSYGRFMILINAMKRGLDHADPYPPGPLIIPSHTK